MPKCCLDDPYDPSNMLNSIEEEHQCHPVLEVLNIVFIEVRLANPLQLIIIDDFIVDVVDLSLGIRVDAR